MRVLDRRFFVTLTAAGLVGFLGASTAEPATPLGPAFQVNSDPDGKQYYPKVESDGTTGSFVVVWHDIYDIYAIEMRRFGPAGVPLGPDFQVNQVSETETAYHTHDGPASVAVDPSGGFVVAWFGELPYGVGGPYRDTPHTFLRLFGADGVPRGDEFTTTSPERYEDDAANPRIGMDASGDFVVVWEGTGYFTYPEYPTEQYPSADPFGQVYDSSGEPVGNEFQINLFEFSYQADYGDLDVARSQSGDTFVVVWGGLGPGYHYYGYSYPQYGVHGRRFLFDEGVSNQFEVVEGETTMYPQIAMDPAGNFLVVWEDPDYGVWARRFSRGGLKLGEPFVVSEDGQYGNKTAVDGDDEGNFVVVWTADEMRGQVFDALGNRRGEEFTLGCSDCDGDGGGPDVAALGSGKFVVTWTEELDNDDVFAQRFAMAPLSEVLLDGTSLLIRDNPANIAELRKATWSARGLNLASPARGSGDDPRCNGDPSGTVKASIRFFSDSSSADTGEIPLPCEKWKATGPSSTDPLAIQGYKYRDPQQAPGRCSNVVLKRTKLVKATCKQSPYDLVSGVDEGTVHAVLALGQVRYCSSFDDYRGHDGSDGLRFQGKDAPAPGSCATP